MTEVIFCFFCQIDANNFVYARRISKNVVASPSRPILKGYKDDDSVLKFFLKVAV